MNNRKPDTEIRYGVSSSIEKNLIGDLPIRFLELGSSSFLAIHPLAYLVNAIFEDNGIHRVDYGCILAILLQDWLDDVVLFDHGFKLGLPIP